MFPLQTIFEINASSRDPSSQVMRAKRQKDRKAIASFQQGRQGRQEDTAGPAPSCPASQEEKPEEEEEEAAGESVEVLLPPLTAPCPRPSFYPQAQSLRSTRTFLSYLICTEGSVAKKYRLKLPGLVHSIQSKARPREGQGLALVTQPERPAWGRKGVLPQLAPSFLLLHPAGSSGAEVILQCRPGNRAQIEVPDFYFYLFVFF